MFVVDMHAPGVTVRPLRDMSGRAPFNEVWFDDVRIPADEVLGEVNRGWQAAVTMLGHERVSIGATRRSRSNPLEFASLVALARRTASARDPAQRERLAELYAHERALELFNARLRQEAAAGQPPGARGSVSKLAGALLLRQAIEVAGQVAGPTRWRGSRRRARRRAGPRDQLRPGVEHRGRHQRGAAQHHRRADPRAAEGAAGRPGRARSGSSRWARSADGQREVAR
jgi:alkylation response protein AidB-like acyl-CoA dehydrogenase